MVCFKTTNQNSLLQFDDFVAHFGIPWLIERAGKVERAKY